MQSKSSSPAASVVKREDKMETLRAFICAALSTPRVGQGGGVFTLVARSAESPVARALVALSPELVARGLSVRAIFGQLEAEKTSVGWSVVSPAIGFSRDLRWAKNPRLADAHEQLVLDVDICWTGDCMRRDPARRDAFEQFMSSEAPTARTLALSFERLWAASEPLAIRVAQAGAANARPNSSADDTLAALMPRDDNSGPLVSSSH